MDKSKFTKKDTNICKGIAILLMYVHHLFYSPDILGFSRVCFWWEGAEEIWLSIASVCKVCVAIFVFLSAYGITVQTEGGNTNIWRRYVKLMFGFWIVYIDSQIFSYFTDWTRSGVYGEDFITRMLYSFIDMLGLSYAFGTPTYNGAWWYMSLAVILIAAVPVFVKLFDQFGYSMILLAVFVPRLVCPGINDADLPAFIRYLPVMFLGICAAKKNWFEKISKIQKYLQGIMVFLLLIGCVAFSYIRIHYGYSSIIDAVLTLSTCIIAFLFISRVKVINVILEFMGRNSMNMFLTHSFVKAYYFNEFTYSFVYPELILIVLVIDTLLISCLLEYQKAFISTILQRNSVYKKLFHRMNKL